MLIYLELFINFFKTGAVTFGGGYAMLPMIREQVLAHGWMTEEELLDFIAISESTPGPFAINAATYVGMETGGVFGALCATLGVVLPSFVMILMVAKCFDHFRESRIVKGCMSGLKPAVIGLIAAAAVSAGQTVLFPNGIAAFALTDASFIIAALTAAVMFILAMKKIHPIMIIALSGLIGMMTGYYSF